MEDRPQHVQYSEFYWPFYCEENVYRLAERLLGDEATSNGPTAYAIFVTNPNRTTALFEQRAGRPTDGLVVWDYHVVLRFGDELIDLDSRLGVPQEPLQWLRHSAPRELADRHPGLAPHFVFVEASAFLREFSSDRSHMRRPDGSWTHPPPAWPAPFRPVLGHNLPRFLHGTHPAVTAVQSLSEAHTQW